MNAPHDPNFFALLLLGAAICYGLAPAFAPAIVILACLWGLAVYPTVAIALGGAWLAVWLLRWPLRIFVEAIIIGVAGGISARLTGIFNSAERAERQRERYIDRRRNRQ